MIICETGTGKFYVTWERDTRGDGTFYEGALTGILFSYTNPDSGKKEVSLGNISENTNTKTFEIPITTDYRGTYSVYFHATYGDGWYEEDFEGEVNVWVLSGDNLKVSISNITETSFIVSLEGADKKQQAGDGYLYITDAADGSYIKSLIGEVSIFESVLISDLTPGHGYEIEFELDWVENGVSCTWKDVSYVTTKGSIEPKISIVSMKRTLTDFTITIRNLGSLDFSYNVYTDYDLDSRSYDIGGETVAPGATATFKTTLPSSSTTDSWNEQINPLFVFIDSSYINAYGEAVDWYYPSSRSNVYTENGERYAPIARTKDEYPYNPYFIQVNITQTFPWDGLYGCSTSSPDTSGRTKYCWSPYTGSYSDVIDGGKHTNIYCSTNYEIDSTDSIMCINFSLIYKCNLHFQYFAVTSDVLTITLSHNGEIINTLTDTGTSNKSWREHSQELDTGEYVLTLNYSKNSSSSSSRDRAYFADFKITPCIPEKWDWSISNGNASDEQTQKSYAAIENRGQTSVFSYLVWNDMVNKVKQVLDYISGDYNSGDWNAKYGCDYENTLMVDTKPGRTLTAKRFNSLRQNVDGIESTNIGEVYSENPNYPVYGWYFTKLMQCVNTYIENNISV